MNPDQEGATYLGDGLYAKLEDGQIKLFASNGIHTHDQVFLEPMVTRAFLVYLKRSGLEPWLEDLLK